MTVREMIKQLINYDMDAQVVDTFGDPIMYTAAKPNKFVDIKNCVRLEPKSQVDKEEWLHDYFKNCIEVGMSDYDICQDLAEQGWTLEDLKNYRKDTYEWALRSGFDWGCEND